MPSRALDTSGKPMEFLVTEKFRSGTRNSPITLRERSSRQGAATGDCYRPPPQIVHHLALAVARAELPKLMSGPKELFCPGWHLKRAASDGLEHAGGLCEISCDVWSGTAHPARMATVNDSIRSFFMVQYPFRRASGNLLDLERPTECGTTAAFIVFIVGCLLVTGVLQHRKLALKAQRDISL